MVVAFLKQKKDTASFSHLGSGTVPCPPVSSGHFEPEDRTEPEMTGLSFYGFAGSSWSTLAGNSVFGYGFGLQLPVPEPEISKNILKLSRPKAQQAAVAQLLPLGRHLSAENLGSSSLGAVLSAARVQDAAAPPGPSLATRPSPVATARAFSLSLPLSRSFTHSSAVFVHLLHHRAAPPRLLSQ